MQNHIKPATLKDRRRETTTCRYHTYEHSTQISWIVLQIYHNYYSYMRNRVDRFYLSSFLASNWISFIPVFWQKMIKNGLLRYFCPRKLLFFRQITLENVHLIIGSSINFISNRLISIKQRSGHNHFSGVWNGIK